MNIKILLIIPAIIILVIALPIFMNGLSNLQQLNKIKQDSKAPFVLQFEQVLSNCSNMTGIGLDQCKQIIPALQQQCSYYDNPTICNDPRISETLTATRPNAIIVPSTDSKTYTNSQFGFSVEYPSNWFVNPSSHFQNENVIVSLSNKNLAPDAVFGIIEEHNTGSSFETVVSNYISQAGVTGYPITLQSQDKVTIDNKDAYRLQYSESIGSATCKDEDFVINDGEFVPVISFNNCDPNVFAEFLPTFEKTVSTFRLDLSNNDQTVNLTQFTNMSLTQALNSLNNGQTANPTTTLDTPNQTTVNAIALNSLNDEMQKGLNECINSAISNTVGCAKMLNLIKQFCTGTLEINNPSYFPVCNDPRLH